MCDIVDNYRAVGIAVVHGSQRLVALLTGRIPNLKLDGGVLVERDCLRKEGGADGRFAERVELVLHGQRVGLRDLKNVPTLTNRRTIELLPTADSPE